MYSKIMVPVDLAHLEALERSLQIAADMAANGGWITEEDLAAVPEPPVLPALAGSYRGWNVHTLPPPAAGYPCNRARQSPTTIARNSTRQSGCCSESPQSHFSEPLRNPRQESQHPRKPRTPAP